MLLKPETYQQQHVFTFLEYDETIFSQTFKNANSIMSGKIFNPTIECVQNLTVKTDQIRQEHATGGYKKSAKKQKSKKTKSKKSAKKQKSRKTKSKKSKRSIKM